MIRIEELSNGDEFEASMLTALRIERDVLHGQRGSGR
jgi:hypothetical protein